MSFLLQITIYIYNFLETYSNSCMVFVACSVVEKFATVGSEWDVKIPPGKPMCKGLYPYDWLFIVFERIWGFSICRL